MASKEKLKDAKKLVNEALKADKKGNEFQSFVLLQKAADHCKWLLKEPGWEDKQRKELSKLRDKAGEAVRRLTIRLTPDQLDAAMAMFAPTDAASSTSVELTAGDASALNGNAIEQATALQQPQPVITSTAEQSRALQQPQPVIASTAASEQKARPVMVRALHTWDESQGASPGDLFFTEGDVFELVSDTEPGYGWWTGFNDEGFMEGIFPANCTRPFSCALARHR